MTDNLPFIFYIYTKDSIKNRILELEKDIIKGGNSKIYFIKLKDMLNSNDSIDFKNYKNQMIRVR